MHRIASRCQYHYRAKLGAQYRWDNTIDAPYRFAMPVRPEIGRARTSRNGTWKNLEKRQFRQLQAGQFWQDSQASSTTMVVGQFRRNLTGKFCFAGYSSKNKSRFQENPGQEI